MAIGAIGVMAYSVYSGQAAGPFDRPFVTNAEDYSTKIKVPCPPSGSLPVSHDRIAVRIQNGTDRQGLASTVLTDLVGRGFVSGGAKNWDGPTFEGVARISFGKEGVAEAYTVARHFVGYEMHLDSRSGHSVDVVLGPKYLELVPIYDPGLDPMLELTANVQCVSVALIENPEPAPQAYPDDPEPSASPSIEPSVAPGPGDGS